MTSFYKLLDQSWKEKQSLVCVGLDPDLRKIPAHVRGSGRPIFNFNQVIIDATASYACAFKPQIAYYSAVGAEEQLEETISYIKERYPEIPVILDAKRGDIGSTADMYAIEAFDRYMADAVTVNPYMGGDTLESFTRYEDKGVIVLCRTSNPGSGELQDLDCNEGKLYETVAALAANSWNSRKNIGLVVGATFPEVLGDIREIVGDMPLLVPGIGAQGGDLQKVLEYGLDDHHSGLLINVSRSVIYASSGTDFGEAAAHQARQLRDQINKVRKYCQSHLV